MADLLRPTLGPLGGIVLVANDTKGKSGAPLADGGLIARRVVQTSPDTDDMGAMLLRNLAWRMTTDHGGGAATAVVMARRLTQQLVRGVEAGFEPQELSREIRTLAAAAEQQILASARPILSRRTLKNILQQTLLEPGPAEAIAEALDTLGADAVIRARQGSSGEFSHSYQEGSFWTLRCASRFLLPDGDAKVRLVDARILVTDMPLKSPHQLTPVLERLLTAGSRSIVLVAPEIDSPVVSLLHVNQERQVLDRVFAVLAPASARTRNESLEDIATISGARLISADRGDDLRDVTVDDLGLARLAWGTATTFGLRGGMGTASARLDCISRLQATLNDSDTGQRRQIEKRIGNLAGAVAEVLTPAGPKTADEELTQRIEAAITTGRTLLRDGGVPGGGFAYFGARLQPTASLSPVAVFCQQALSTTLAEPLRLIAANAGLAPARILAKVDDHPGQVFDVRFGEWIDPWTSGDVESVTVCCAALRESVETALQAISIEVLVPRRNPPFPELP